MHRYSLVSANRVQITKEHDRFAWNYNILCSLKRLTRGLLLICNKTNIVGVSDKTTLYQWEVSMNAAIINQAYFCLCIYAHCIYCINAHIFV